MKISQKLRGFTVVEMLIVVPIVILVIGVFIGAIVSMTGEVLATRANNSMSYNIQDALDRIRQDVSLSGGFLATNNITLSSPQGYNNDTTAFHNSDSTNGNMLILNIYTTTGNPNNANRNLVYASGQPNQCNSILYTKNANVMMNIIYFTKTDADGVISLWRRTVAPSGYSSISCSIPWQQPSCAKDQTGILCKTNDTKLVDHISPITGFQISYFPNANSVTPIANASDSAQNDATRQAALTSSNTVGITINASDTVAGRDISQSGTARITGANNNITATTIPPSCPSGFIRVPGSITYGTSDFCVMKYEAKNVGGIATSQAALTPWVSISQATAIATSTAACVGCHLITDPEWLTIAQNVLSVGSNWSGGVMGSGYIYNGNSDGNPGVALDASSDDTNTYYGTNNTSGGQRRTLTLTNGEVIWDLSGNVWEWTSNTVPIGKQPGLSTDTDFATRDWTQMNIVGSMSPNSFPSTTGLYGAETWISTHGIGTVMSYAASTFIASVRRGGEWSDSISDGVLCISLNRDSAYTTSSTGFRVSK